jgi:hypothetical protein
MAREKQVKNLKSRSEILRIIQKYSLDLDNEYGDAERNAHSN